MAAKSRLCSEPDDFAGASTAGAALPFLPTLAFAAILGLGAVCWETAAPLREPSATASAAVAASTPMPRMARADTEVANSTAKPAFAGEVTHRPPAAIVFAHQFPLSADTVILAKAPVTRPLHRVARSAPSCTGSRCTEPSQTASAVLRRPHPLAAAPSSTTPDDPFASSRQVERAEASVTEGSAPDQALPFAPAIRAVGQTVGVIGSRAAILRGEAVALGGVVTDLLDGLR